MFHLYIFSSYSQQALILINVLLLDEMIRWWKWTWC